MELSHKDEDQDLAVNDKDNDSDFYIRRLVQRQ